MKHRSIRYRVLMVGVLATSIAAKAVAAEPPRAHVEHHATSGVATGASQPAGSQSKVS